MNKNCDLHQSELIDARLQMIEKSISLFFDKMGAASAAKNQNELLYYYLSNESLILKREDITDTVITHNQILSFLTELQGHWQVLRFFREKNANI